MTEKTKETLERTERALCMHLDVLDGEIERAGGDVKNHMVIDGAAKQTVATVTAVK